MRVYCIILDADLAELYAVPTKRLNEQVRRNQSFVYFVDFPRDFSTGYFTGSKCQYE